MSQLEAAVRDVLSAEDLAAAGFDIHAGTAEKSWMLLSTVVSHHGADKSATLRRRARQRRARQNRLLRHRYGFQWVRQHTFDLCWLLNSSTHLPASELPTSTKQAIMSINPYSLSELTTA